MSEMDLQSTNSSYAKHEPLSMLERRVLGVLIEKQKTSKSPDAYPMTLNSLTIGCNQKSNRDPVLELSDDDVEETLISLGKKGFTVKITGGRAERFRHLLYDVWKVSKIELAILAELMMRGPQSEGDLRGRASRMDDIADLDQLRTILKSMVERHFVVYLTEPDRRGAMLTHGFHLPEELLTAKAFAENGTNAVINTNTSSFSHSSDSSQVKQKSVQEERLTKLENEFELLRREVEELKKLIAD